MKKVLFLVLLVALCLPVATQAQIAPQTPVIKKINETTSHIEFTVLIDPGWHVYAQEQPSHLPVETVFNLKAGTNIKLIGPAKEIGVIRKLDKNGKTVHVYEKTVTFVQEVKMLQKMKDAKLTMSYKIGYGNTKIYKQIRSSKSTLPI
ncbi:MAG TPA: protein-disulfide reductase DsbD domain-containing protein [Candidatus Paceibacterota bacterium]|nr:protein-disulfide reductase DsbD domain-containing protein [Candidatus Paceibacterota bacterium]